MRKALVVSLFALVTVGSLSLGGCTIKTGSSGDDASNAAATKEAEKLAPTASVEDGATGVDPSEPVIVKSLGEGLEDVTMVNELGKEIKAEFKDDQMSWTTSEDLGYNRTYTIKANDRNGKSLKLSFSTAKPVATAAVALSPLENSTVGVGQVIGFRFGHQIVDRNAAQNAIKITTTPHVEGAFYWLNNVELRWRPKEFWEPGTKVTVEANIYGKDLGGGVWGAENNATSFTIGDRVEAIADDHTKTLDVYKNGELLRKLPISMGSNVWPTPNGIYTIGDLHPSLVMNSETFGLSEKNGGYKTKVLYASQMSYSGIYVHAAPWSVWAQGSQNTSHGCLNVSTENAKWFQNTVKRGDIVTVKNTIGGKLSGTDGLGDWNIPWDVWSAGNANDGPKY